MLKVRPAPMSVYNGILRSYFLLGTKINFASNNDHDEKIVDHIIWFHARQSLLSLHMTKSYVRTATRTTLKVEANLTQILNFKANFHTEFEPFLKKKIMLTMVDTLRLSA